MAHYCLIVYPGTERGTSQVYVEFPSVRHLAAHLNKYVAKNKTHRVITAYVCDEEGVFLKNVKFLQAEYRKQRWITGYKERLLANAVLLYNMDLNWNNELTSPNTKAGGSV
ncbi:hypothetical protein D3C80_1697180 [compost metagenome]